MDHDGTRHAGGPPNREIDPGTGPQAVVVKAWDPEDEDDYKTMLVPALGYFDSWYDILSAIGHALANYGIEMG